MDKALPECLRVVATLRAGGFKYIEIARLLHLPVGTVKQRIHRIRNEFNQHV